MTLPLTGIRLLDVTNVLAGPFCSFQLALLGADPAAAARLMGTSFVAVNAGKQSVTINLKAPEGKEIFKKLVAISHVVLENFRPEVMKRLQLGYDILSKINPSI